jgi:hypothetical protein
MPDQPTYGDRTRDAAIFDAGRQRGLREATEGWKRALPSAEALARQFHEAYEALAPQHGYETRKASAKPWGDVPANNRALMIATCAVIRSRLVGPWQPEPDLPHAYVHEVGYALCRLCSRVRDADVHQPAGQPDPITPEVYGEHFPERGDDGQPLAGQPEPARQLVEFVVLVDAEGRCGCCRGAGEHRCGSECDSCDGSGRNPDSPVCTLPHGADCRCTEPARPMRNAKGLIVGTGMVREPGRATCALYCDECGELTCEHRPEPARGGTVATHDVQVCTRCGVRQRNDDNPEFCWGCGYGVTVATQEPAVHAEEACPDCSCCTRADCARRYCDACPCTEG